MKRLALLGLALVAVGSASGSASPATKEYSTGTIDVRIGTQRDERLVVRDAGPVSFVRVSFRITARDTSRLALFLLSPRGTEVPLVVHRGAGANFGSGPKGCGGSVTVLDPELPSNPVSSGQSPFTDNPYRPEGNLQLLAGEEARGRWTLRIENDGPPATLHCFKLDISRRVPETLSARSGAVRASLRFVEDNYRYERLRLSIVRAGRTVVDAPLQRLGCRDCNTFRPVAVRVRDLDGGQPEVLVRLYSGGAHCCLVELILRYDPAVRQYRSTFAYWGNFGARLVDLDRDGRPEFSAFDERFVYTFTAYVFSVAPIQIWQYHQGKLVDVTRRFPALVRKEAVSLWHEYEQRRAEKEIDVRAFVAAYVADQYLLGRPDEAKRALDLALRRGDLSRGPRGLGWPAGRAFVAELLRDLRKWGYLR